MAVAEEIRAQRGRVFAMRLDVGESAQVRDFVERIAAEFGPLDVMVANAGIAGSQPFLEHSDEHWHRVLRVNLHGVFYMTAAISRAVSGRRRHQADTSRYTERMTDVLYDNLVRYAEGRPLRNVVDPEEGY